MELYVENRENRRIILNSVQNGPLVWPTIVQEDDTTRTKKYEELSVTKNLQADCDLIATNIVLQGLVVPVFTQGDDPIACLNKAMAFLSAVAASRFPSTNNLLRTSSNLRNQATIQDDNVTVRQVQGRQGLLGIKLIILRLKTAGYRVTTAGSRLMLLLKRYGLGLILYRAPCAIKGVLSLDLSKGNATSFEGNNVGGQARVVKCYNCQGEGHMARQCTQPKRPRNDVWFKDKEMLAEAQESDQMLDEEQLAFLADLDIPDDAYDSDCDDVSNAKAVLMANLSNYGSDVISEAAIQDTNLYAQQDSMILSVIEQMSEQMINHVNNWKKANQEKNNESLTIELERYKERVKTFVQRLNIDLSTREKIIDS
ncbi:retrovirus-related pol polyprotein from transposon TNT 1-94 [Tanacetum coccineum]